LCLPPCGRDNIQENSCKRSSLLILLQPKPLFIAIQVEISGDERTKLLQGRLFDPLVVRRFAPNNQRILFIRSGGVLRHPLE